MLELQATMFGLLRASGSWSMYGSSAWKGLTSLKATSPNLRPALCLQSQFVKNLLLQGCPSPHLPIWRRNFPYTSLPSLPLLLFPFGCRARGQICCTSVLPIDYTSVLILGGSAWLFPLQVQLIPVLCAIATGRTQSPVSLRKALGWPESISLLVQTPRVINEIFFFFFWSGHRSETWPS